MWKLFYVEIALLIVVLVVYPAALWGIRGRRSETPNERAMFMPRGSVRAMIALLVVASFVNVLVLGHHRVLPLQEGRGPFAVVFSATTSPIAEHGDCACHSGSSNEY